MFTKRTAQSQSAESRLIHLLLAATGFFLVFKGPPGWRFLPDSPSVALAGLMLTIVGAAVAVWARVLLGANWSAVVTIKQDHQIVRRGPYKVVRHPIYSGTLLALLGTAIAIGEARSLAGFALLFIAWWMKSRLEESFLERQFGADYSQYKRKVKGLIPFVL
jgi:protein-S-isoprenylcysteine O-methyltransferase Ste14